MGQNLAQLYMVGNAVDNPEIRVHRSENGRLMVTFRVGTNHRYLNAEGEWKESDRCFMEVQCWNRLAENVLTTVTKGMPVIVIGRLVQSAWEEADSEGKVKNRYTLRLRASHVGPDLNIRDAKVSVRKFAPLQGQAQDQDPAGVQEHEQGQSRGKGKGQDKGKGKVLVGAVAAGGGAGGDAHSDAFGQVSSEGDEAPF